MFIERGFNGIILGIFMGYGVLQNYSIKWYLILVIVIPILFNGIMLLIAHKIRR